MKDKRILLTNERKIEKLQTFDLTFLVMMTFKIRF